MCKNVLVVTALLMFPFGATAVADETPEHQDKRAQKILATLRMFGIADPKINEFVQGANSRVEKDGYFYLADHTMADGRMAVRFDVNGDGPSEIGRLQLSYTPKDSHYAMTASNKGMMMNYHYEFK